MTTVGLSLTPVDVLFFRDGRPLDAGAGTIAGGTLPGPQALTGALRSYLMSRAGVDFHRFRDSFSECGGSFVEAAATLGPDLSWLARMKVSGPWFWRDGGPRVPAPANLVFLGEGDDAPLGLIAPSDEPPPGWRPEAPGLRPLLPVATSGVPAGGKDPGVSRMPAVEGYLDLAGLRAYAAGECPGAASIHPPEELRLWEDRTGLAMTFQAAAARDGYLYSARYLRLKAGVSFYASVTFPEGVDPGRFLPRTGLLTWGGEGRTVRMETWLENEPVWPAPNRTDERETDPDHRRWATLLLSPALFPPKELTDPWGSRRSVGWHPPPVGGARLVGAAVPGGQAVSGWDLARRQPKPLRWAVPAGSVYFWEGGSPPGPGATSLADSADDTASGWGDALVVSWPSSAPARQETSVRKVVGA